MRATFNKSLILSKLESAHNKKERDLVRAQLIIAMFRTE